MTNPKSLHLHQLEEACKDLNIDPAAREVLKTLMEAMAKDHAIYFLSVFQEEVVRDYKTSEGLSEMKFLFETFQQRIAREYTTT